MSEVRALLLTDVVDSTQLSQRLGEAELAALWAAHDRIARDLLPVRRGREIDKTDGMLLLFETAADAVGYAMAYQRALAALNPPLKARAGVHVGPVILRENSPSDVARGAKPLEVEGAAKALAARVMAIAGGGQTLMSADARSALGDAALRIESHGHWRMKGIAEPIELFEVGEADAAFVPPPDAAKGYRVVREGDIWLPARNIKHSLPAELDSFVGRRETLAELARRLDAGARLVSVLGIGGTGKTRLVTRFGWSWLGDFPGGVWFCDLSQARSTGGIVYAVAEALAVPLGKEEPVAQLGNAIAARGRCLIILDNFEQVSRHAEETLGRWLKRATEARFVATTREVLGLAGEETLALAPLPAPDAAALFVQRAESAKRDFQSTEEDKAAVDPLVKLLEGLPLAIELAAARVRVMPPRALLSRMSERFKLLSSTGGRRDRQATLRSTFDWSWDLLSLPDKAALAQLSVFEGGFTMESAEVVLDLSGNEDEPWTIDTVQSLLDKSFVRQVEDGRFDMLVSVKEYAAEHLRTEGRFHGSGPAALVAAEARHSGYFARLGEKRAVEGACVEIDNLVAACRRAAARGAAEESAGALGGAWAALNLRGPFNVGVELALLVGGTPGLGKAARATAERIAGSALDALGKVAEARTHLEAALALAREAGDSRCEARVLANLADLQRRDGRSDDARASHAQALALARGLGDRELECKVLNSLGSLEDHLGRLEESRAHWEAALAIARRIGDRRWEGGLLGNLGGLHFKEGRLDEARDHLEAGLVVARELGDRKFEGNALCNLGLIYQLLGKMEEAGKELEAALVVVREIGHVRTECVVLCNQGIVYASVGRPNEARARYEAALAVARELGDRRSEGQVLGYLGLLHARQARFDEARVCLDTGEALLRAMSDRLSLGVLLCGRAEAAYLGSDLGVARGALAEADSLAKAIGAGPDSELGLALARVLALASAPETVRGGAA
jgi:predicted ATPase/class 3 adenylate cyclase/Tfp pilus assembly protein PilF